MGSCALKQSKQYSKHKNSSVLDTKNVSVVFKPCRRYEIRNLIFSAKNAKVPRLNLHTNSLYLRRIAKNDN
ncbi:hypothetical protein SteCoe_2509 [Stentor coeruleus]|uniref:Uncharacterized protein n=1 Tax=Stentor coeruleus TaxID=5963 RepID=A0A1R2CZ99_9CILI|nr:hypothetical protein SteCoe_2509 [Stentor coeruleus]